LAATVAPCSFPAQSTLSTAAWHHLTPLRCPDPQSQALPTAEAAVGRLLSAARAAAPFRPGERGVVTAAAGSLAADLVSAASRLRALRDALEAMRG
jgi:hypothetical protein